ncbi:MAG: hypothetical protein K9H61_06690 [Bacteroidia bacterium]|nr:hypothetical protein [Bacteroidia bacterium]MCF8446665.1 hypothetical protein [Bacteroidia bacterium]
MKKIGQILVLFIATICKGQMHFEGIDFGDIQEIILNHKEHQVSKFKIIQTQKYNNRKEGYKYVFHYSIKSDSLLTLNYKDFTEHYIIRNNAIIELTDDQENSSNSNAYFEHQYDSANTTIKKTFRILEQDTQMVYFEQNTFDSLKRVTELMQYYGKRRYCYKWTYSFGDTYTKEYFKYDSLNWQILSREVFTGNHTKQYTQTGSESISIENSLQTYFQPKGETSILNTESRRIVKYTKVNLIHSILREEKDTLLNLKYPRSPTIYTTILKVKRKI